MSLTEIFTTTPILFSDLKSVGSVSLITDRGNPVWTEGICQIQE